MAKITRIKASDDSPRDSEVDSSEPTITRKKVVVKDKKTEKAKLKKRRSDEKAVKASVKNIDKTEGDNRVKTDKAGKKTFILFRPFVALGRYLRDSWRELRQVRWPNRKATWKMVLAVLVYTALFVILISLLDLFFTWLFGLILSK